MSFAGDQNKTKSVKRALPLRHFEEQHHLHTSRNNLHDLRCTKRYQSGHTVNGLIKMR